MSHASHAGPLKSHRKGRPASPCTSVQVGHPLLFQPLFGDGELDAAEADGTPDPLAPLAGDVLVVLVQVEFHGEGATLEAGHRALHRLVNSRSNSGKCWLISVSSKLSLI